MTTRNRKHRVVRELGMYFAEKGKVIPAREYKSATDRPKFLSMKEIVKVMGSYTTAVSWIEKYEPELWDTIHGIKKEPAVEEVSPLEKLASLGKENGKDI
jgi:hypothetical protein